MGFELKCRLTDPAAAIPVRHHGGSDAGADLSSIESFDLNPGERRLASTGVSVEIPSGMLGFVVPRSGLAAQHGITIVNAPGLIDSGYRGEIMVCLLNTSSKTWHVNVGDRIAQLVVQSFVPTTFVAVDHLDASDRGERGFGSTGVSGR